MEGTSVGSFTILRKLGEGGMGAVYLAAHRRLDRLAAVKMLLPELSTNEDVVRRFFTEARATSLIDHPGIVEILDCDVLPSGRAYIVMEFLRGEGLAACIRRLGDLRNDFPAVLNIAEQMAGALAEAHAKGIIHRDLKPDNVHLLRPGARGGPPKVKILDFGIAKLAEAGKIGSKTRTGSLLGTPLYMSPEQCRSSAAVDARSDVYSLGCMLFEMVCGRPPFLGEGFGDLVVAHVSEPPPRVTDLQPSAPAGLGDLIAEMLAKSRDDRPPSMHAVAERLRALAAVCPPAIVPLTIEEPPEETIPPQVTTPVVSAHPSGGTALLPEEGAAGLSGGRAARDSSPDGAGGTRLLRTPPGTTLGQAASQISERSGALWPPAKRGPGVWVALGIVLAAAGGGGAFLALRPNTVSKVPAGEAASDPTAHPEPPATHPSTAPAPAEEAPVTIRVSGMPAGTEVTVDGVTRALPLKLARSSDRHVLQFRAPGYQDARREIESDRDQDLTVSLQRDHRPATERPHHHPVVDSAGPERPTPPPAGKKSLSPITDL
jgi:eukaryotic-like serine/threonine-protein kinase